MILVIAGTHEDFLDYCKEKGLNPHSRPATVRYVRSYGDFIDVDNAQLVLYNGYEKNPVHEKETWEFLIEYGKSRKWKGI